MSKIKVTLSYEGTHYKGFQFQPNVKTVEGEIKKALENVYHEKIAFQASGRTDAGVHSLGQVISYSCDKSIPLDQLIKAINAYLPTDIRVLHAEQVDKSFSARRSAKSREYAYLFTNKVIPIYLEGVITRIAFEPSETSFDPLGKATEGEKDFEHFRNLGSNEKSTVRNIYSCKISKRNIDCIYKERNLEYYEMRIVANSFLYRMVRNLVGAMFEVMKEKRGIEEYKAFFIDNTKSYQYTTAPAKGLSLIKVKY